MDFFERCSESEAVAEAVELQQADQSNKAFSQEQIEANAIPKAAIAPVPLEADNGFSNVDHPKGIRFALLFSCIIVGCFLFGYVRIKSFPLCERETPMLNVYYRIPAVSRR